MWSSQPCEGELLYRCPVLSHEIVGASSEGSGSDADVIDLSARGCHCHGRPAHARACAGATWCWHQSCIKRHSMMEGPKWQSGVEAEWWVEVLGPRKRRFCNTLLGPRVRGRGVT